MDKDKLLITGMSPGNGYFKQEVIDKLLVYCSEKYSKVEICIPDIPAIYTYLALGYSENKAREKAIRLQGNNYRNRINNVFTTRNLNPDNIKIWNWAKDGVEENPIYRECFDAIKNLYDNNIDFKKDINMATEEVLVNNQFKKKELSKDDIVMGAHYIISEFAFILYISKTIKDYNHFIFGYHRPWPVWEKFIAGGYDGEKKDNLSFLLLPNFSN
ncbi:MAG: hypothetical protein QG580_229 [Patescibacteria group bacterium]|nr:hypothetical protein [Patescibacteria group bacterium]